VSLLRGTDWLSISGVNLILRRINNTGNVQGDQNVSVHLIITVQKTSKNILNSFNHRDNVVRIRDNIWR
jgi:hypothetical protein